MTAYIGYDNVLDRAYATVTASSVATASGTQTFDVQNCFDWLMFDYWKPSSPGNATISVAFSIDTAVDYIAAWGQQSGTRYQLEKSEDGVTWSALSSIKDLNGASFDKFTSATAKGGRASNLLRYSEKFENFAWNRANTAITSNAATAPDGTTTAELLEAIVDGNDEIAQKYGTTAHANKTYTFSVWIKNRDRSGSFRLYIMDGSGGHIAQSFFSMTSDWQRFSITGTVGASPSNDIRVFIDPTDDTSNAGLGYYVWGAQLEEAATVGPYVQTTSAAITDTAAPESLRIRLYPKQNLLTYSEQFDTAWVKSDTTVTSNATTAPDGTTTADLLEATVDGNDQIWRRYLTTAHANKTYTFSVWIKNRDRSGSLRLTIRDGEWAIIASGVFSMTSDWQRISITGTFGASPSNNIIVTIDPTDDTSNAGLGYYVWGAQLEEAATAGAYVQTTSSAVEGTVQLPMIAIGEALELGGIRPGFAPPATISHGEAVNSISEDGYFLGRSTRTKGQSMTIHQTVVAPAWARSNLAEFSAHALQKPYFFAWDEENYPAECAVIVPPEDGGISAPQYDSPLYMKFSIRGEAWS